MVILLFILLSIFKVDFCEETFIRNETIKNCNYAIMDLAKKLEKDYGLKFLNSGESTHAGYNILISLDLMGQKQLDQDGARALILKLINNYIQMFDSDSRFLAYQKLPMWCLPGYREEPTRIKLSLWNENLERFPQPYISLIKVYDDRIEYYSTKPNSQSLVETPFTETYEEGLRKAGLKSDSIHS